MQIVHSGVLEKKISRRYLFSSKNSAFLSLITWMSIGGVFVGVVTLLVTLAIMAGFENELKKRLFAADSHILIESKQSSFFSEDAELIHRIESSIGVTSVAPILQTEVIIKSGKKISGAILKGIDSNHEIRIKKTVIDWSKDPEPPNNATLYLGSELAYDLGLSAGDNITLISPLATSGPMGAIPDMRKFKIAGIYKSGLPDQEMHVAFTSIKNVQQFLKVDSMLSHIEVQTPSLEDSTSVAHALTQKLGPSYLIRAWHQLNEHLFSSLKLERTTMFCLLFFIVIVASFNIVSSLTMMVVEKRKSLAILRALGTSQKQIERILLFQGFWIATVGIGFGVLMGLLICWALQHYPIIELPDVFYDRSLPVIVHWEHLLTLTLGSALIVFIGALIPARRSTLIQPIDGIKNL